MFKFKGIIDGFPLLKLLLEALRYPQQFVPSLEKDQFRTEQIIWNCNNVNDHENIFSLNHTELFFTTGFCITKPGLISFSWTDLKFWASWNGLQTSDTDMNGFRPQKHYLFEMCSFSRN